MIERHVLVRRTSLNLYVGLWIKHVSFWLHCKPVAVFNSKLFIKDTSYLDTLSYIYVFYSKTLILLTLKETNQRFNWFVMMRATKFDKMTHWICEICKWGFIWANRKLFGNFRPSLFLTWHAYLPNTLYCRQSIVTANWNITLCVKDAAKDLPL